MKHFKREEGAAAVEFALVLPVLLLLVFGVLDFSRLWYLQTTASSAARAGVRTMAIENNPSKARDNIATTFGQSDLDKNAITFSPNGCTAGSNIAVDVPYTVKLVFFPKKTIHGKAVMRCGG